MNPKGSKGSQNIFENHASLSYKLAPIIAIRLVLASILGFTIPNHGAKKWPFYEFSVFKVELPSHTNRI